MSANFDSNQELALFFQMSYAALHDTQVNFPEILGDSSNALWIGRIVQKEISLNTSSKIEEAFQSVVKQLVPLLFEYAKWLQILSAGGKPENALQDVRNAIIDAYQVMGPWVTLFSKFHDGYYKSVSFPLAKKLDLFVSYFPNSPFKISQEEKIVCWLERYYSIIVLENVIGGPLPIDSLKILSRNLQDVHASHIKNLEEFVKRLRNSEATVSVRDLHKGISATCAHINHWESSVLQADPVCLNKRIATLWDIFLSVDPYHLDQATHLECQMITYNDGVLKLGYEIPGNQIKPYHRVFEVEGRSDCVLRVFPNRAYADLFSGPKSPLKISFPKAIGLSDVRRRYALMEKIVPFTWEVHAGELLEEEKEKARLLGEYIESFLELSPQRVPFVTFENLGINHEGQLCALKVEKDNYVTVPKLEEIVFKFSAGSLKMYQEVLNNTRFTKWQSLFYDQVIRHALDDAALHKRQKDDSAIHTDIVALRKPYMESRTLQYGEAVYSHSEIFFKDAQTLYFACFNRLRGLGLQEQDMSSLPLIIYLQYLKNRCVMRLWPTMVEDVVNSDRKALKEAKQ